MFGMLYSLQAAAHLQPRPLVLLASSDGDMQQLMDSHTYWLELLQVRQRKQHTTDLAPAHLHCASQRFSSMKCIQLY
jgi:5'-3' exonuclease